MKKKTPARIFLYSFLKSFILIGILIVVGFGSYKATMLYYAIEGPPENEKTKELIMDIVSDAKVEPVGKNLIFSQNENTGEIEHIILEITNTYTNNIDYVTMPLDTKFTLGNEFYQRLFAIHSDIPQIIQLSELHHYFEGDSAFEYGELILEELLGIEISYYSFMESEYFNTIFEDKDGLLRYTDQWKERISKIVSEEDMKDLLEEIYENGNSNLAIRNKEKYIPTYLEVELEYIYFYRLFATENPENISESIMNGTMMLEDIINNEEPHKSVQKTNDGAAGQSHVSSKGYNIRILNGSGITGLASHYKDRLIEYGYTVISIGNYSEMSLTNTKIVVAAEGLGYDLTEYFKEAEVQVGEVEEGVDIQIILGKLDNMNE